MARKIKIKTQPAQRGLFDFFDEEPAATKPVEEVHPTIKEYAEKKLAEEAATLSLDIDTDSVKKIDAIKFISLGSGSSGNCSYLGDDECGILIDAGVDADAVQKSLRDNGLSMDNVRGICLTHDHSDHVRFVYKLIKKRRDVAIFCTPKVLNGMLRRHSLSRRIKDFHRPIYKEFPFKIGQFEITAFEVSHDGTDNAGFFITHGDHKFAIATDLGCITPRVEHYMRQAQYIMIESNYDADMLQRGSYPMYLKARIVAERGHLDNEVSAAFISRIYTDRLRYVYLCHLSQDNNTPEIALNAMRRALNTVGVEKIGDGTSSLESRTCPIQVVALPRFKPSELYTLRLD